MSIQYPCVLTTGQLARCLGVNRHTVTTWLNDGLLRYHQLPNGNHDRRIEFEHAYEFACIRRLPLKSLEQFGRQRGALPGVLPMLLFVSPIPDRLVTTASKFFEVVTCTSAMEAGALLRGRCYDAVLIDAALGTRETGQLLGFIQRLHDSIRGVLAREDEPASNWIVGSDFPAGVRLCWDRSIDPIAIMADLRAAVVAGPPRTPAPPAPPAAGAA